MMMIHSIHSIAARGHLLLLLGLVVVEGPLRVAGSISITGMHSGRWAVEADDHIILTKSGGRMRLSMSARLSDSVEHGKRGTSP